MAQLTFILGNSGTGKSTSLRNFKKSDSIGYITPTGKVLPFKSDIPFYHAKSYTDLFKAIRTSKTDIVVIDDFNYFMSYEEFSRINVVGYGKFAEMAKNVIDVIDEIVSKNSNQRFYIMAHTENRTEDNPQLRLKTTGKMVNEKFVPEGLVNQVVETVVQDGEFNFKVKTDGLGVKTPFGMFNEEFIENDLKLLDNKIKEFYGLEDGVKNDDIKTEEPTPEPTPKKVEPKVRVKAKVTEVKAKEENIATFKKELGL